MADDLKKVGLVFKADGAVNFQKTLKGVNQEIQNNRAAFALAKSEWDESTTATQKLRTQQEYLQNQTESYSRKVNELTNVLEQLNSEENKNEDAIAKTKQQLDNAKTSLNHYQSGLDSTNKKLESGQAELEEYAKSLQKSLDGVDQGIKNNEASFARARSEWTKSTKVTEKLKTEQGFLEKQTADYSDKVDKLKNMLVILQKAEEENKDEIAKKKIELENATESLNNYKKRLDDVNKELKNGKAQLKEYADKLETAGEKMDSAGKKLSGTVTAGIVAAGTASVAAWKQIDGAYDSIAAGTGATGEALQKLTDSFDNVYGEFPTSTEELGGAIADINTRFGFTDETLEDCTTKFLEFARVNNTDVSSAIANVSRYMGDASIDSSEYASVLDSLTAASQASGISVDKLAESCTKYGAPMRAIGFDTQSSIAIFAQWEKAGVNTEIAFSGMKTAISKWSAEGKNAKDEFNNTLESIKSAPDIASATTLAIEAFGKKAGPDLADAIQGGRFSLDEFMKVVEQSGGTLDSTWANMYDGADKAQVAMQNLGAAGAEVGDVLMESAVPILEDISDILQDFCDYWDTLDEDTKEMIIKIDMVAAALGPILIFGGQVASGLGGIIGLISKLMPVITGLFSLLAANPIVLVIAEIVALVAVIVYWWNTSENFRNFWIGLWDGICDTVDRMGENVRNGINDIKDGFKNAWKNIKEDTAELVEKIKDFFDFEWKLPDIKMPHFSAKGDFSWNPLKFPKISVDWYANGGILNRPTVFGMNGSKAMVGGEAGPEAVLPIEKLKLYIRDENQANNATLVAAFMEALQELHMYAENNIFIGDKKIESILTDIVFKKMNEKMKSYNAAKGW